MKQESASRVCSKALQGRGLVASVSGGHDWKQEGSYLREAGEMGREQSPDWAGLNIGKVLHCIPRTIEIYKI